MKRGPHQWLSADERRMRGLSESRGCLEKCGYGRVGNTGNDDGQGLWRRHGNGNREARKVDETEVIKEASQLKNQKGQRHPASGPSLKKKTPVLL